MAIVLIAPTPEPADGVELALVRWGIPYIVVGGGCALRDRRSRSRNVLGPTCAPSAGENTATASSLLLGASECAACAGIGKNHSSAPVTRTPSAPAGGRLPLWDGVSGSRLPLRFAVARPRSAKGLLAVQTNLMTGASGLVAVSQGRRPPLGGWCCNGVM